MSPQRRTALVSVVAACVLIGLKLVTGLATDSLGLVSEAAHSGTDLVAALLTLFAVGVAVRPADRGHPYGHGKAEHLAALGEAGLLVLASLYISYRALTVLVGSAEPGVDPAWYALFVALLVLLAAGRLMRTNIDVLMDRVPADAERAARAAIARVEPRVELRRLRMRQAAGRHFADVVIGVSPDDAVGQGHAAADAVEAAVQSALPESDIVVHVEPSESEAAVRERVHAAALTVPRVREVHNLRLVAVDGGLQVALHLKLPGELTLEDAHVVASRVEQAIGRAVPEVVSVQTHLEPLREPGPGSAPAEADVEADAEAVLRIVRDATGAPPRELRFLQTEDGLVVLLTLALDPASALAQAHARASEVEEEIRRALPGIADVIVHTEP